MTHCYTFQFNLWFNYNRNLFFLILEFYVVCKNGVSVNHSFRFSSCYVLLLKITETHWITQWPGRNMDNKPEHQAWTQTNIDVTRHEHHNEPTRTEWGRKVYIPRDRQTLVFYSILFYSMSQFTLFSSKPQYRIAAAAANRSQITLVTSITVTICNCFWHRRDGPDKCFHKLDRDWCTFGLCVSCSLESLINSTRFQQNFIS